jgi:hypothetical protein
MHLGRYQLGNFVLFSVSTVDSSGNVILPDSAPTMDIFVGGTKVISEIKMPLAESKVLRGLFRFSQQLDNRFSIGRLAAIIRYPVSGVWFSTEQFADILAGGDPSGAIVSMHQYEKPTSRFLIHATDSGKIFKGKNPRTP